MGPTQDCSRCETTRPLTEFAKDARLKSGRRSTCKPCDRALRTERRGGPKPSALVLVPTFPTASAACYDPTRPSPETPDAGGSAVDATPGGAASGVDFLRHGSGVHLGGDALRGRPAPRTPPASYAESAERVIDALVPPAGPADALLVRSLRGLAELLDNAQYGIDRVKDTSALVAKLVAVQRELASTRAAKSAAPPAPAKPLGMAAY